MSAPQSPAELQRLYAKRFAGTGEYRNKVWRVLVEEYFARGHSSTSDFSRWPESEHADAF
jgi:hypothetical protein